MALVLLAVGGCAAAEDDKEVVASFYPVYVLLQNVTAGVEGVSVRCLTAPSTGCLHDYQLLTQDMRALETACVFVINGAGMESFLPVVAEGFPDLPVVDSSEGIDLLANEPGAETPYNAHIWLAPENAARMVENMVAGLSEAMPEHAEAFAANGAACVARLKALDEELRAGLENLSRRNGGRRPGRLRSGHAEKPAGFAGGAGGGGLTVRRGARCVKDVRPLCRASFQKRQNTL